MLQEDRDELQQQVAGLAEDTASWVLEEIDTEPPYSFLMLEKLRDDYEEALNRRDVTSVEIDTSKNLLRQAKQKDRSDNVRDVGCGNRFDNPGNQTND